MFLVDLYVYIGYSTARNHTFWNDAPCIGSAIALSVPWWIIWLKLLQHLNLGQVNDGMMVLMFLAFVLMPIYAVCRVRVTKAVPKIEQYPLLTKGWIKGLLYAAYGTLLLIVGILWP